MCDKLKINRLKKDYDVAIIGGGSASVVMLNSILRYTNDPLSIIIFSDSNRLGPGYAYQKDVDSALLNRPLHSMSIDKYNENDAVEWLDKHPQYYDICYDEGDNGLYMPRWVFGQYLEDRMRELIERAELNKFNIDVIYDKVSDVDGDSIKVIQTLGNQTYRTHKIIYCCGHNSQNDIYDLVGTNNYIHNPYPLSNKVNSISPDATVAVIGSSLTAIDIVLSLNQLGHKAPIDLLSRKHVLPYIRGPVKKIELSHLNEIEIEKIVTKNKIVTIKDLVRLLSSEMKSIGYDWKMLFRNNSSMTLSYKLSSEMNAIKIERQWQSALISTNAIIEKIWYYMSDRAKQYLIENYNRPWLNSRSPIPVCNARKLMRLLDMGMVNYRSGLKDLKYNSKDKRYNANIRGKEYNYNVIINATGPSKYPLESNTLLTNMIRKGSMIQNPWGGIEVDYRHSNIIDTDGNIDRSQYMVGQNTSGVYYYTTSLEMIVKRCDIIAKDLALSMQH